MAGKKKRRVEEDMEDEENYSFDGSNITIPLDLKATEPFEWDAKYLEPLLQQQFLKAPVDVQELAGIITSQNVGSVSRQCEEGEEDLDESEDDDDDDVVWAFLSVINLTERKDKKCVQQLTAMLKEKCQECGCPQAEKFCSLLDNPHRHVGLILNERYINLPPIIAVPSFRSLRDDLVRAKAKKEPFDFGYYILIGKTSAPVTGGKKAAAKQAVNFQYDEEELIFQLAEFSFSYSVMADQDTLLDENKEGTRELEPFRTVMVLPGDKLNLIVSTLEQAMPHT